MNGEVVLRKAQIEEVTGLCERQLRDLEVDGKFPKRFTLIPGGRVVGWKASEVMAWIDERAGSREPEPPRSEVTGAPEERRSEADPEIPKRKGGRPKGSRNKATTEIREAAQKHGRRAIRVLVKLLESDNESVRLKAAQELLWRAYGKSTLPLTEQPPEDK